MGRPTTDNNEATISFTKSPAELERSINDGFAAIGTPFEVSIADFFGQNELAQGEIQRHSYPQVSKLLRNLWTTLNNQIPSLLLLGTDLQRSITEALALENPDLLLFLEQEIELGNLRNDPLLENWERVIGFYEGKNPPQNCLHDITTLRACWHDAVERINELTNLQKSFAKWCAEQIEQDSKFLPLLQQRYIEQTLAAKTQLDHIILGAESSEDWETNQGLIATSLNNHPDWLAGNHIKSDYNKSEGRGNQLMNLQQMPCASAADIRCYEMGVLKDGGLDQTERFQQLNQEAVEEEEKQRSDATKRAVDEAVARFSTTESSETKGNNRLSSGLTKLFGQKKKENVADRLSLLNVARYSILEEQKKFTEQGSPQESVNQKVQGLLTTGIMDAYETKLKELKNSGQQNQQSEEEQKNNQSLQQNPRRLSLYEQNLHESAKHNKSSEQEQELETLRVERRGSVNDLRQNFEKPETKVTPLDIWQGGEHSKGGRV